MFYKNLVKEPGRFLLTILKIFEVTIFCSRAIMWCYFCCVMHFVMRTVFGK